MITSSEYSVSEIASVIGAENNYKNFTVDGIGWDSRESFKNYCYFVFKGENFDGISFVSQAIKNGATLIISDRYVESNVPILYVKNTKDALCRLARYHKGSTKIIGITGSAGKTTTKEMIKNVLSTKYSVTATLNNENNEIGVAKTLLSIKKEDFCVVEMGMRKRGEIEYLSSMCNPDISVITNALSAHIGILGSKEEIFKAKTEILKYTKKISILPSEDRFKECEKFSAVPIFVGENGDVSFKILEKNINGLKYIIKDAYGENVFNIPTFTIHNVYNSMFAYTIGRIFHIDIELIKKSFESFVNIGYRDKVEIINGITLVVDCYNASYDGMKSALDGFIRLCAMQNLRPNILLGTMYEIEPNEKEYHYRIGELARDLDVQTLLTYGDFAEYYTDGFMGGEIFDDKKKIAKYIISNFGNNDAVLIKAGRRDKLEEVIFEMKELVK